MDIKLNDILVMKKEHPCKTNLFEIVRVGVDIKIKVIDDETRVLVFTPYGQQYEELCEEDLAYWTQWEEQDDLL